MDEQAIPRRNNNTKMIAIGVIALIVIAAISVTAFQASTSQQENNVTQTTGAEQGSSTPVTESEISASEFEDGTYTAMGTYISPGGQEELEVTLTIKKDIITESQVEPQATRPNSVKFQEIFASNYKTLVIGKNINEVQLTKVSGSSLSPNGFNDAVEKIKAKAES